jgi:hypothetical protein
MTIYGLCSKKITQYGLIYVGKEWFKYSSHR